ncbi:MAG: hypothetical protein KC468_07985, partial [Myxococcales bacterium]|nr:hypothetical protein [Myxococcales bacterium]
KLSPRTRQAALAGLLACAAGCNYDIVDAEGEFGKPINLGSGDALSVPRLAMLNEACPGPAGGCPDVCTGPPHTCPDDACKPVLIDSLTALTTRASAVGESSVEHSCLEVRSATELWSPDLSDSIRGLSVTRFRFDEFATVFAPEDPNAAGLDWDWRVGNQDAKSYVGAVIGGNLLRDFGVRFYHERRPDTRAIEAFTITLYRNFVSTTGLLADQGRAFISVQYPGRLLGKEVNDVCQVGEQNCDFAGPFDFDNNRAQSALQATRISLDACVAPPPGAVLYDRRAQRCKLAPGVDYDAATYISPTGRYSGGAPEHVADGCVGREAALLPDRAGVSATFVVATGVPDVVLFADSAERMFGPLDALPACDALPTSYETSDIEVSRGAPICVEGQAGQLYVPGWPPAGLDAPLLQLRLRSLALVPGLLQSGGDGPCTRLEQRTYALRSQCGNSLNANPPSPGPPDESDDCAAAAGQTAALIGEVYLPAGARAPDPARWLPVLVLPADHSLVENLRRDTSPDALQPDGLLGTALIDDTDVVLDYDQNDPGISVRCLNTDAGRCLSMPACALDDDEGGAGQPRARCCHGLPRPLLNDLIIRSGIYACCSALSERVRLELNGESAQQGLEPLCPESNVFF